MPSREPVTIILESGEMSMQVMSPVCPLYVLTAYGIRKSHNFTFVSAEPDAIVSPLVVMQVQAVR